MLCFLENPQAKCDPHPMKNRVNNFTRAIARKFALLQLCFVIPLFFEGRFEACTCITVKTFMKIAQKSTSSRPNTLKSDNLLDPDQSGRLHMDTQVVYFNLINIYEAFLITNQQCT